MSRLMSFPPVLRQFNSSNTSSKVPTNTPLLLRRHLSSSSSSSRLPSSCFSRRSLHNRASFTNITPQQQQPPPLTPRSRARQEAPPPYHLRFLPQSRAYSGFPPPQGSVKFWPFFVIIGLGSLGYYLLARKRHEAAQNATHGQHFPSHSSPNFPVAPRAPTTVKMPPTPSSPAFDPADVTVIFVLGGPGAGKGTQSARLVETYGFTHLSAGDLLRAEQKRPGSEFGELISNCIRDGAIVPMEVTVKLLENAMRDALREKADGKQDVKGVKGKFLIDGFPRKMDQAVRFEDTVCKARFVLFFDCPEDELEKRLLERGKTSGRSDDNPESIRKRFRTFVETSMPVVDNYEKEGRVIKITATASINDVFKETQKQLTDRLGSDL